MSADGTPHPPPVEGSVPVEGVVPPQLGEVVVKGLFDKPPDEQINYEMSKGALPEDLVGHVEIARQLGIGPSEAVQMYRNARVDPASTVAEQAGSGPDTQVRGKFTK